MTEFTEIKILDTQLKVNDLLKPDSYWTFFFKDPALRRKWLGGNVVELLPDNVIKFQTQMYYEFVPLSQVNAGTSISLAQGRDRHKTIAGEVINRHFEPATRASWKVETEIDAENSDSFQVNIQVSSADKALLYLGLTPIQMEDKWFSFVADHTIRYLRSWTGLEVFQAKFEQVDADQWVIRKLLVSKERKDNKDAQIADFERRIHFQLKRMREIMG